MQRGLQTSSSHSNLPAVKVSNGPVVCIGEPLIVLVPTAPGALEYAETFTRSMGGAEANVAVGLASLGTPAALVGRVGDDGFGRYLASELAQHGVDTSGLEIDPVRSTGVYLKEVGGNSGLATDLGPGVSRMHYYRAGSAASALSPATVATAAVAGLLRRAPLIHTTGITPGLSSSAAQAQRAVFAGRVPGQLLSFDLNWRPALWRGREREAAAELAHFMRRADIALIGAPEALAVFGTSDPDELRAAFPEPRVLVVKNDGNIATGFDGANRVDVPALRLDVVEAIGAGDAFAAGLLDALLRGTPLAAAISVGHACAARALASRGDHIGHVAPVVS
jgi:2-dehydro-3-deoxygluconokinase